MNAALTAILGLLVMALIGGSVDALLGKDRGLVIGAILGAIAAPVGYLLFWMAVFSTGIFGSGG